jgi:hypothetical protein
MAHLLYAASMLAAYFHEGASLYGAFECCL